MFLASDLCKVLDPNHDCFQPPPFACSVCGSDERVEVKIRAQEASAMGKLVVRRLKGIRQVPVWGDELLGDRP